MDDMTDGGADGETPQTGETLADLSDRRETAKYDAEDADEELDSASCDYIIAHRASEMPPHESRQGLYAAWEAWYLCAARLRVLDARMDERLNEVADAYHARRTGDVR